MVNKSDDIQGLLTRKDILRLTNLSPRQIQYWDETGLVQPKKKTVRRRYYDFANVVEFRIIEKMMREGFSTQKVRKFLLTLKKMMPRRESVLSQLRFHTDGKMLIIQEKGAYFETNGQGLLSFDAEHLYQELNSRHTELVNKQPVREKVRNTLVTGTGKKGLSKSDKIAS